VRVVILQPMYLPWMGFFGMLDVADTFVIFDDAQYMGRTWQRRNRIKTAAGHPLMLSVPTRKAHRPAIRDVQLAPETGWADRHWRSIRHAYAGAPHWDAFAPGLEEIYRRPWHTLLELDLELIRALCRALGLPTDRFVFSSALASAGAKTDRLLSLLAGLGADEYVSGPAARAYLEPGKFRDAGVRLRWFEYRHPVYPQLGGEFLPYMSALDVLFNAGPLALATIRRGLDGALVPDPATG
jgi:hypothetical protein